MKWLRRFFSRLFAWRPSRGTPRARRSPFFSPLPFPPLLSSLNKGAARGESTSAGGGASGMKVGAGGGVDLAGIVGIHREVSRSGVRYFSLCASCGMRLEASATLCEECAQRRSRLT